MNLSIDEIVMCLEALQTKERTFEEELLYRRLDDAYIRHEQNLARRQTEYRASFRGAGGHAHS